MSRRTGRVALLSTLLFVSVALFAQVTSSSIFGTVTDSTGAVVPGVEVKVTQVNYPVYGPGATTGNVNDGRPIQPTPRACSSINVIESEVNNSYHGLQITAEKRTSHGVSFKGFYLFSKSLEGANDTLHRHSALSTVRTRCVSSNSE